MRLYARVFDPTYTTIVGDGPIPLISASFTRPLDKLGRGTVKIPGNNIRALTYLTARRVLEVWTQEIGVAANTPRALRKMGAFVIDGKRQSLNRGEMALTVDGTEVLLALKDKITLPGLTYEDTLTNIYDDLTAFAGWTDNVEGGIGANTISVRFDGESLFKSAQVTAEFQGVHIRSSVTVNKQLDVGVFGTVPTTQNGSNLRLEYIEGDTGIGLYDDDAPLVIEKLTIIEESNSDDMCNYALVLGGGQGDAVLTLENSTRPGVVTVNDGIRDHFIIKDDASIALFGQIEKRLNIKRLAPIGPTDAQIEDASNALFDAGDTWLERHKEPYECLKATVRNAQQTFRSGDKVRVIYRGVIYKDGLSAPYGWREIDADYWIMSVTENVGESGLALELELSTIDRHAVDAAEIVVGQTDAIEIHNVGAQPYRTSYSWGPFQQPTDTSTPVEFQFPIFENALRLIQVKALILRSYWTAVAGTAAAGGDHRHKVANFQAGTVVVPPANFVDYHVQYMNSSNTLFSVHFYVTNGTSTLSDWYTSGASGTHTHATVFDAVQQDNVLPEDCSLVVNGVLVSSTLFPTSGGSNIEEIDITAEVLGNVSGFRGWHDVSIDCGTNRGDIAVVFFIEVEIATVRAA